MRSLRRMFLILALLWPAAAAADTQLWLEAGLDKELSKKTTVSFVQNLRFDEDVSRVMGVMPDLGLDHRAMRWLDLGAGYRLAYERRRNGDMELRHRLHVQGQLRFDAGDFRLRYRLRFQERIRSDDLRHVVRNRIRVDYRGIRPWVPIVSAETFHRLADDDPIVLRKRRYSAGLRYGFRTRSVDVAYLLEDNGPFDPTAHVLSIGFHQEL
jgi:hypothetical protein